MSAENERDLEENDEYKFDKIDEGSRRPECVSCGDPVKIIVHSGGTPMAAQHCKECYAELRWGKIPKTRGRRRL